MSTTAPSFYAWCHEADRVDAFVAAASALDTPGTHCLLLVESITAPRGRPLYADWRDPLPLDELIAAVRTEFEPGTHVHTNVYVTLSDGRLLELVFICNGETYHRRYPYGPLEANVYDEQYFFTSSRDLVIGNGTRSAALEGAIDALYTQADTESILLRLCAPDEKKRVSTGACGYMDAWCPSLEMSGTYHAEAKEIARDLALSWVNLHEQAGDEVGLTAEMPLEMLAARVEAAPRGARVGIAPTNHHTFGHFEFERQARIKSRSENRPAPPDLVRKGPRVLLPGDELLTREQVLAALATPPAALLEALEACAAPDDEWRAVEPLAREAIEAKGKGAPTVEVDVSTDHHRRFIEHHAPYHVRRLPNGGVMLATHPYRTLWPLWVGALDLLGIRAKDSE